MAESTVSTEKSRKRPALLLAKYETPNDIARAAIKVRDAGYSDWDCHTPYPLHGLDEAMGLKPTRIGIVSFIAGLTGIASAIALIHGTNNVLYPLIVGGKPADFTSFPSMGPIIFELGILFTGFATLFTLFKLAKLPRHNHPIFESDIFESATDDKYFISIDVSDAKFDLNKTKALLKSTEASHVELVEEVL